MLMAILTLATMLGISFVVFTTVLVCCISCVNVVRDFSKLKETLYTAVRLVFYLFCVMFVIIAMAQGLQSIFSGFKIK